MRPCAPDRQFPRVEPETVTKLTKVTKTGLGWLASHRIGGGAVTVPAITAADVRAGVARELRALADLGLSHTAALARAVEITAAKIHNSPVLVERQAHDGLCHTCNGPLDDARPVVAVMQAKGGGHLWMHGGECHDVHRQRRAEMVDTITRAAGYGVGAEGKAA